MELRPKSVSEFVNGIKQTLESQFKNANVVGEISNLSLSSSGHWYFTLSDQDASVSVALFKLDALKNPIIKTLKDGMKVQAYGDVSVFTKRGTFQIIVKKIIPLGAGDLKEQFEKLKNKLRDEGLFDLENKKPIPLFPKRVAVITAKQGAALQDFINIYKRRSLKMDLLVVPALVQGENAPKSIREALLNVLQYSQMATLDKKIDVIVLCRGGGSLEDLWAFNDEGLAYDIFNSPIPIISAIGHEVDFSISDFVADLRAETPSAAAERLTQYQTQVKEKMKSLHLRLSQCMTADVYQKKNRLLNVSPLNLLHELQAFLLFQQKRLADLKIDHRLNELTKIHDHYRNLDDLVFRLTKLLERKIENSSFNLEKCRRLLFAVGPESILNRGYSILSTDDKKYLKSSEEFDRVSEGTTLSVRFIDGVRKVKK